jgi:SsrA-binding protein
VVRERKLLLTNKEIKKMERMMDKGLSIIPVSAFVNDRGLIKMQIAIARGKKNWDKRETIKKRDLSRG